MSRKPIPAAILAACALAATCAPNALGATFETAALAPEAGVSTFDRTVAQATLERSLFASPSASIVVRSVDVYDVFPYVETHTIQLVADAAWDRVLVGEAGGALVAFDGKGASCGPLSEPRGLAVDALDRIYLCDSGNDRVLVLGLRHALGATSLAPVAVIEDSRRPIDVAVSFGDDPLDPSDDRLYVVEAGRGRIVAYALGSGRLAGDAPREIGALGALGGSSAPGGTAGRLAGPSALAVRRVDGRDELLIAENHAQRLTRVAVLPSVDGASVQLARVGETALPAQVSALETDRWGNLLVADVTGITKLDPTLQAVTRLDAPLRGARDVHVPWVRVRDHRTGSESRFREGHVLVLDRWSESTGLSLWKLDTDVIDASLSPDARVGRFILTDRAEVECELVDLSTGRILDARTLGTCDAGERAIEFPARSDGAGGPLEWRVTARSAYGDRVPVIARTTTASPAPSTRLVALASEPNPFRESTRIRCVAPASVSEVEIGIFDLAGRRIRAAAVTASNGVATWSWDGRNEAGRELPAGLYLFRADAAGQSTSGRLVLLR